MGKIFSFNEKRNGSYVDPISGAVSLNQGAGEMVRAEKGIAWRGNGVDSFITYPSAIDIGTVHSIVINYKSAKRPITEYSGFMAWSSTYMVRFRKDISLFQYRLNSTSHQINSTVNLYNEEPHQLIITRDGADLKLYVDGIFAGETTITNDTVTFRFNILGKRATTDDMYLAGELYGIKIYDDILTEKERAKLFSEFQNAHPITKTVN